MIRESDFDFRLPQDRSFQFAVNTHRNRNRNPVVSIKKITEPIPTSSLLQLPIENDVRMIYGNNRFVGITNFNSTGVYSDDGGETWSTMSIPSSDYWGRLAYGNGSFVLVETAGSKSCKSIDGINWVTTSGHTLQPSSSIAYGENVFISIQQNYKTIYVSIDGGLTWQRPDDSLLDPIYVGWVDIAYGNGKFFACQANGATRNKITYSNDLGQTWTPTFMSSLNLKSVAYGNGKYIALSNTDVIAYSEDGENWTEQKVLPTLRDWRSVRFGNGYFVAVGYNSSVAIYSADGLTWSEVDLYKTATWNNISTDGNGKFIIVTQNSSNCVVLNINS